MVPPDPPAPLAWQPEERVFDVTRVASTSVTPDDFLLTSSFGSGPYYSDTSPYSIPVNQVNFDPVGVEDQSSTFLTSNLSFDSNTADAALDLTQRWIPRIPLGLEYDLGLMFEGDPVSFYVFIRAPGSMLMIFKGNEQRSTNQRRSFLEFRASIL